MALKDKFPVSRKAFTNQLNKITKQLQGGIKAQEEHLNKRAGEITSAVTAQNDKMQAVYNTIAAQQGQIDWIRALIVKMQEGDEAAREAYEQIIRDAILTNQKAIENASLDSRNAIEDAMKASESAIARIGAELESIKADIAPLQETGGKSLSAIEELENRLTEGIAELREHQNRTHHWILRLRWLAPEPIPFNPAYDRRFVSSFFEYKKRPDYKERFQDLIRDLDDESRAQVVRVLYRHDYLEAQTDAEAQIFTDLFSDQEKLELTRRFNRIKAVLQLTEDCYCMEQYLLPIKAFHMSVFFDRHGLDYVENLQAIRGKDIIDAGGYIGDSLLILCPLTDGTVHSFEGISEHIALMEKTIALNELKNAKPVRAALGINNEDLTMYLYGMGSSALEPVSVVSDEDEAPTARSESVPCMRLDDYVQENNLQIGLIKIDVEGFEQDMLRGAEQTIRTQKPVLLVSIYHNAEDFFQIKPMLESWNLGYRFRVFKGLDQRISADTMLIAEVVS